MYLPALSVAKGYVMCSVGLKYVECKRFRKADPDGKKKTNFLGTVTFPASDTMSLDAAVRRLNIHTKTRVHEHAKKQCI